MNRFDQWVLQQLNGFAGHYPQLDYGIYLLSINSLMKGGVLMLILWWLWFRERPDQQQQRETVVQLIILSFVVMVLARVSAKVLPFRVRPMHNSEIDFILPYGMEPRALEGWSAFPSDHAALFYALSAGIFLLSYRAGLFALLYSTLMIMLPRLYLGLHHPTNVVGGALLGIIVVWVGCRLLKGWSLPRWFVSQGEVRPHWFYPGVFLLTFQIADMFNGSRALVGYLFSFG